MNYETDLNRTFDLLFLAKQDTALRKAGAIWWVGPCPFCGGRDRFVLKQTPEGWRWFCRGCGDARYHTPVDYVMQRERCDFRSALNWIGGDNSQGRAKVKPITPEYKLVKPSDTWQRRAMTFVEICESALWDEIDTRALTYLRESRGLKDETIHRYHLGYNPSDVLEPLEVWGLPDPDDGKRHAVWMPRGIMLPCFSGGALWCIKFRRPLTKKQEKIGEQKYLKLKGSKPGIFGADNLRGAWLAVLTEGEFDCMLLDQEAGDLVGVATLGSATDRVSRLDMGVWGRYLLPVAYILAAYDLDQEGEKGLRALEGFTDRVCRATLPEIDGVKDITDYWKLGGNLGNWIARIVEKLNLLHCATAFFYPLSG